MAVSIREFVHFVAIYEEGSMTAAAHRVNATQPGVSQTLRKLEETLQVQLFNRMADGVLPTPAGDRFYQHCAEVLRAHSRAIQSVNTYSHGGYDQLNIGLIPTVTIWALAPTLERFVDDFPNVRLQVVEGYSGYLTQQVQAGVLDFAVVPYRPNEKRLNSRTLLRTPEVFVSNRDAPMPKNYEPIQLRDYSPIKMIAPTSANVRRETLETYLQSQNVIVERIIAVDGVQSALRFVAQSEFRMIAPAVIFKKEIDSQRLNMNPLRDPELWTELVVIELASRAMSPAAEAFFEILLEELRRLNAQWVE